VIESIHIQGFKSLRDVKLRLGALNLFVGANASGKSNFFDALRVLQGLAYGFTIDEVLNGKPRSATGETWDAIRGGSTNAAYRGPDELRNFLDRIAFDVDVRLSQGGDAYSYSIVFDPSGDVLGEKLTGPAGTLFDTAGDNLLLSHTITAQLYKGRPGEPTHVDFGRSKPILRQLQSGLGCPSAWYPILRQFSQTLSDVQIVDPAPELLREYSRGIDVKRMGDHGENFASLINSVMKSPASADAYTAWLQQLTPAELDRIDILRAPQGEFLFALAKNGHTFTAQVLSDGTLRFAAIAAAFFQPDMPKVLLIEEIEKGLHPTRLRLMVELLKSQASRSGPQVMATTHSPLVLSWLDEQDYSSVFFCAKDPETGASSFTPLSEMPHLADAIKAQPLGDLFSEGWLEAAL